MRATIGRLATLLLAITPLAGCVTSQPGLSRAAQQAAQAIPAAERAVMLDGRDADRRALLATAYLRAGRFRSAARAFEDVLTLRAPDARTALNLALTQIAADERAQALETLDRHAALIPLADRGLALALAGQPRQGVVALMAAMRLPGADAHTRQNLALALALCGEWSDAHMLVALDLDPLAARRRILEWMRFAQPQGAADQVASLLKITPAVDDPGPPVALALRRPIEKPEAIAERADTETSAPLVATASAEAATPVVVPARATALERVPARGRWFVQVGAYTGARLARADWARITRRVPVLNGRRPSAIAFTPGSRLYRLSVGGFALADADAICVELRAHGGRCYVRAAEGDRPVAWYRDAAVRIASR
ncbi:SPOR domain-containing protein [Sphingomonas endophytica]|uniref:SPOR domain-containing protein n=1 Tax=Sphingomonas endophytica TaxID=869719 RepID=A0A147I533_9SPHN|nr:SPOR domain-containing protein [Sphingomonas endophytica]KTT73633.1 hypothetical protein NS334_07155 [Sphingomonas endophytica]